MKKGEINKVNKENISPATTIWKTHGASCDPTSFEAEQESVP